MNKEGTRANEIQSRSIIGEVRASFILLERALVDIALRGGVGRSHVCVCDTLYLVVFEKCCCRLVCQVCCFYAMFVYFPPFMADLFLSLRVSFVACLFICILIFSPSFCLLVTSSSFVTEVSVSCLLSLFVCTLPAVYVLSTLDCL